MTNQQFQELVSKQDTSTLFYPNHKNANWDKNLFLGTYVDIYGFKYDLGVSYDENGKDYFGNPGMFHYKTISNSKISQNLYDWFFQGLPEENYVFHEDKDLKRSFLITTYDYYSKCKPVFNFKTEIYDRIKLKLSEINVNFDDLTRRNLHDVNFYYALEITNRNNEKSMLECLKSEMHDILFGEFWFFADCEKYQPQEDIINLLDKCYQVLDIKEITFDNLKRMVTVFTYESTLLFYKQYLELIKEYVRPYIKLPKFESKVRSNFRQFIDFKLKLLNNKLNQ